MSSPAERPQHVCILRHTTNVRKKNERERREGQNFSKKRKVDLNKKINSNEGYSRGIPTIKYSASSVFSIQLEWNFYKMQRNSSKQSIKMSSIAKQYSFYLVFCSLDVKDGCKTKGVVRILFTGSFSK